MTTMPIRGTNRDSFAATTVADLLREHQACKARVAELDEDYTAMKSFEEAGDVLEQLQWRDQGTPVARQTSRKVRFVGGGPAHVPLMTNHTLIIGEWEYA
jgi:hypothetical protein